MLSRGGGQGVNNRQQEAGAESQGTLGDVLNEAGEDRQGRMDFLHWYAFLIG
ncbi:MAG: hypothetical protein M2R46_01012 [Verrucomicrobia subdivision 3 bacterium]|nr:hypothetical protein [Limisphaerales bacterium]